MMHTLCVILICVVSVYAQNTRILRDIISPADTKTEILIQMLGAPASLGVEGIPYIDSDIQWLISLNETGLGFDPLFVLSLFNTDSPHYQISAIEIMTSIYDGACGLGEMELATISRLGVQVGSMGVFSDVNTTSYLRDGFLDLDLLGLSERNDYIRFRIPPMLGDEIRFVLEDTAPSFKAAPTNLCLQLEFIGVDLNAGTQVPPGPRSLLQYNMEEPTFSYRRAEAEPYDDVMYKGVRDILYTGDRGKLTDGIIGTDPSNEEEEWVGFNDLAGLRLFFDDVYPVKEIRVYYWSDLENGAAEPDGDARDRNGDRIMRFQFSTYVYNASVPELKVYAGVAVDPVDLDYLLLRLRTPEESLLISEVSVLQEGAIDLVDIPTGIPESQISFVPEIPAGPPPTVTGTISPNTNTPPLPPNDITLAVIFGAVGIVSCLFIVIASMCVVFVLIFCVMQSRVKKELVRVQKQHSPIRRKSSSRYEEMQQMNANTDYMEVENIYQQVDKMFSLPLPPIPGEESKSLERLVKDDSYIEIESSHSYKANGLSIDTSQTNKLVATRTLSEDDYAPVTPPSASVGLKGPPNRTLSDPYVAVTPPPDSKDLNLTQIENYQDMNTGTQTRSLATLGMSSISNEYATMTTNDSPDV